MHHSAIPRTGRDAGSAPVRSRPRRIDIDPLWLDFGPDDPLEAERWLNDCAACGASPSLVFEQQAHQVRCACGASATPGKLPFTAAFNWNKSPGSKHPPYQALPFFQLEALDIDDARVKLNTIRDYLVEQKRHCESEIRARRDVGHRYFQRIKAYLAWSIYALGLVREQELAQQDAPADHEADHATGPRPGTVGPH
ncbi:hypothetical protein ACFFGH_02705 [Lysobacter korlensis]|uniref:Uncharacterized protein n=1 Tax=Lysobacter korlensis TaxID=553636 RepID=A0ABV6RJL1_9GAMM